MYEPQPQQQVLGHTLADSRAQANHQAKALGVEREIMVSKSHVPTALRGGLNELTSLKAS